MGCSTWWMTAPSQRVGDLIDLTCRACRTSVPVEWLTEAARPLTSGAGRRVSITGGCMAGLCARCSNPRLPCLQAGRLAPPVSLPPCLVQPCRAFCARLHLLPSAADFCACALEQLVLLEQAEPFPAFRASVWMWQTCAQALTLAGARRKACFPTGAAQGRAGNQSPLQVANRVGPSKA